MLSKLQLPKVRTRKCPYRNAHVLVSIAFTGLRKADVRLPKVFRNRPITHKYRSHASAYGSIGAHIYGYIARVQLDRPQLGLAA